MKLAKKEDIESRLEELDFDEQLEVLSSLYEILDGAAATEIFERHIENNKGDYSACTDILLHYVEQNQKGVFKYLPYLNHIIFKSTEEDYSLFAMSYTMKKGEKDGEWIALDEHGNIYTLEEGMEAVKLKAAIIYYKTDKHNWEVKSFLKGIIETSKFENHKAYLKNALQDFN